MMQDGIQLVVPLLLKKVAGRVPGVGGWVGGGTGDHLWGVRQFWLGTCNCPVLAGDL